MRLRKILKDQTKTNVPVLYRLLYGIKRRRLYSLRLLGFAELRKRENGKSSSTRRSWTPLRNDGNECNRLGRVRTGRAAAQAVGVRGDDAVTEI
jgi:hypothetical protein